MAVVEISFKDDDRSTPIGFYNLQHLRSIFSYFDEKELSDGLKCDLTEFSQEAMEHLLFISDPEEFRQFSGRYPTDDNASMEFIMSYVDAVNLAVFLKAKANLVQKIIDSVDVECIQTGCACFFVRESFAYFLSLLFPYEEFHEMRPVKTTLEYQSNPEYAVVMFIISIKTEKPFEIIEKVLGNIWSSEPLVKVHETELAAKREKHKYAFTIIEQAMLFDRCEVPHWKPVRGIINKSICRLRTPHGDYLRKYNLDNPFEHRNDELLWRYIRFSWIHCIMDTDDLTDDQKIAILRGIKEGEGFISLRKP